MTVTIDHELLARLDDAGYLTHERFRGVGLRYDGPEMEDAWYCPGHFLTDEQTADYLNGHDWFPNVEETVEGLVSTCDGCTPDEDGQPTGRVLVHMIGDDTPYAVEPDELEIHDGPICSCGQTGCRADPYDYEDD